METPSPRYILTRAAFIIAALVVVLYGFSYYKKWQRRAAIISELRSLASDSSYFHQFYAEDAKKAIVRAIGLIAEADQLGVPPETAIKRSQGIETQLFAEDTDGEALPLKEQIIMANLRANYENFRKLGYKPDFQTISEMRSGSLPPIPSGPEAGKKAIVATLIDSSISAGMENVLANLEIRPPQEDKHAMTDIEIAAAKRLASDLADAKIIEQPVRDRIIATLTEMTKK